VSRWLKTLPPLNVWTETDDGGGLCYAKCPTCDFVGEAWEDEEPGTATFECINGCVDFDRQLYRVVWGKPSDADLAAIPDYPPDALPSPAWSLVASTGLPAGLVAGAARGAMATAVGPRASLRVVGSWKERAILWLALVAPKGAGKSPSMELAYQPLAQHDQGLDADQEPLLTTDATVEAVARVMHSGAGAATVYLDELSVLLRGMGEYTGGGARGRWLALWTGAPWRYTRVGSGGSSLAIDLRIPTPTAVIIGGLQPSLHELLGGSEDGLRPRWLPHYAEPTTGALREFGSQAWEDLLHRLIEHRDEPREWVLGVEALAAFEQHRDGWLERSRDESETVAAALTKAPAIWPGSPWCSPKQRRRARAATCP
jgi:hypothetical protein